MRAVVRVGGSLADRWPIVNASLTGKDQAFVRGIKVQYPRMPAPH